MALVRAVPLKNFLDTALSTTAAGTAYSTVFPTAGQLVYAALHLTSVSTGRTLVMTIQSASSSGFTGATTEITFSLTSVRGATMQNATPSTAREWRRANWTLSTGTTAAGSTAGTWAGLVWGGIR